MTKTISEILTDLEAGRTTAVQLVEAALERLDAVQEEYHVALSTARDRALQRARSIDEDRAAGKQLGRLAGVPFIAKDNFLTFGTTTTAAAKILENFTAPYQATAVERLEAEGAIMIAKANLDAFAHGSSTENSYFGPTKNAVDSTRVPGGSSGGSATAVALDIVPFALGSDTGGSIRQPASLSGVIGIKPTYGLVSRYGVIAMASSTDTIGAFAHTADDIALVMDVMAGKDDRDSTTLPEPSHALMTSMGKPAGSLKIGIVKEYITDAVQPEVREAVLRRAEQLRALGHTVEEISIPSVDLALAIYYIVVPAEISSNLSRYDGIKYGLSVEQAKSLDEVYGLSRDQGFMAENKRRILIGAYVLSSGYYDAYYRKAQTARTILISEFNKAFADYDILLGPVSPTTAFKLGENTDDPLKMYLADIMTVAVSLAGLPAISVPSGVDGQGLPIGVQLIGKQKSDGQLLAVTKQLEEAA